MPSIINAALSGGLISTGDTSGQLQLQTAGTTALTVTSAQQVGIGTSSPANTVQISSPTTTDGIRLFCSDSGGEGLSVIWQSAYGSNRITGSMKSSASGAGGSFLIKVADTSAVLQNRLFIDNAGYLGIGKINPATIVDIYGPPSTASITIQRSDEAGYGGRVGCGNTLFGPAPARSLGLDGYSQVSFGIAGTQRMYLDSFGALYLTIGTYFTSNVTPMTAASVASNPGTAAVWDASGNLYKLASSLRYKENITDWNVTDEQLNAFINVNPKLWDYIGKENGCGGFIAEDIEALGLKNAYNTSPLINYSNEGQPDSNRDFALIALQHKVLQKQQQAIQELFTQLTELKAEVATLRGA